ncbi:methyl-galactoside transport system substrate-binding protein [Ruminiclostridium sufflavum DSM 19573]|uniref:D-galactose/methyl-galactoside binding periplasmic protein MglB n=1 Tax=Ruminiclostridium sufflavum DSM 19573 TaxID=1121337 RepID=A0A318XL79_9FIRM|nr:galactose ABC transporter substrate-binding protein [Ruminiclostridium sufflavum]PYG88004.1 methyl-galactoside transport system substrate-binding protein [Ruminiclostridium sufflavum DSM 19573]
MKSVKKCLGVTLSLALLTSVIAGCSSSGSTAPSGSSSSAVKSSEEDVNATVIWRRFDDAFQSGFRIIMQSEADKMGGLKLDMQDGEDDPSKANNKLETALTKGADSIAICAPDRKSTDEMMKKCKAEDVPVVFFNMEPMPETMKAYDKVWYVGANAKESGQMCAQALINYWKENNKIADKNGDGKLQLVILQGELGQQDVVLRTEAYEETLKAQGIEYEILAKDTANWDKAQALDKMNTWITAFGIDKIEGVLCNSDGMAMGAVQAALDNGYNKGDKSKFIPIVGIDATVEALQSMKNNALLGTVLNDRTSQSKAVLNVLKTVNSGGAVTKDIVGVDCTVEDNYIWVPYKIVDQTNLEEVLKMMTELEGK